MKAAYKSLGYHVAAIGDAISVTHIIITGNRWGVMMEKKSVPRKVLGLLAEHIGDIPEVDEGYKVRKGDIQTEIHENAVQTFKGCHDMGEEMCAVKRTGLTLNGYQLWQSVKDLRVMEVDPKLEDIAFINLDEARLVGEQMLMAEDLESRAYITVEKRDRPSERLAHLSKHQWVVT